ncbi:MAG: hypothetical protein AB1478_07075 [Nitrospirota bacterium]
MQDTRYKMQDARYRITKYIYHVSCIVYHESQNVRREMDMKKRIAIMIAAILLLLLYSAVYAGDDWQVGIKVSVLNAENRLSIGQRPDATDGIDGRYDVPALLSGDIMAYIELEGGKYWRDIKGVCEIQPCTKEWNIFVESELEGKLINLKWNPSDLPLDMNITLTDTAIGVVIDIKKQSVYEYENTGKRQFRVEMTDLPSI